MGGDRSHVARMNGRFNGLCLGDDQKSVSSRVVRHVHWRLSVHSRRAVGLDCRLGLPWVLGDLRTSGGGSHVARASRFAGRAWPGAEGCAGLGQSVGDGVGRIRIGQSERPATTTIEPKCQSEDSA
jgi:hypothetical protein